MTWESAIADYLRHCQSRRHAPTTLALTASILRRLARFCAENGMEAPAAVTEADIAAFRRFLLWLPGRQGKRLAQTGVARALATARAFFRWATEQGHVLLDPTRSLVVRRVLTLRRLLTVAEMAAILAAPDPGSVLGLRDRAVLEMLYGTGLRRTECAQLDLDDVDLRLCTVTVRRGKGAVGRVLPMGDGVATVLERYLEKSRPRLRPHLGEAALFLTSQGYRVPPGAVCRIVGRAAERAGIGRKVGAHDVRHATASHLLAGGADIRHVQALLGHATLMSTQRYTHLQPLDLFEEHRRTHPRARQREDGLLSEGGEICYDGREGKRHEDRDRRGIQAPGRRDAR